MPYPPGLDWPKPGTPEGDKLFRVVIKIMAEIARETGYKDLPDDSFWVPRKERIRRENVRQAQSWAFVRDLV